MEAVQAEVITCLPDCTGEGPIPHRLSSTFRRTML